MKHINETIQRIISKHEQHTIEQLKTILESYNTYNYDRIAEAIELRLAFTKEELEYWRSHSN